MLIISQYCGEFDNWGAIMSVSGELLCSFELLKPLDSAALKSHIKKGRNKRNSILNSPVSLKTPLASASYLVPSAFALYHDAKTPYTLCHFRR